MAYKKVNHQFFITGAIQDITTSTDYSLNGMIQSVAIKKDYSTDIMPLFVLKLLVPTEIREVIRKDDVKISIKIDQFSARDSLEDDDNADPVIEDNLLNTMLRLYDKNIREINIKEEDDPESDEALKNQKYEIVLPCIPDLLVSYNDDIVNTVYNNANMDEILIDVLAKYNMLYLDPSDNREREECIFIPPLNISKAIEYLDENYGIYDTEASLFFDTYKTYMYKKYGDSNGYYENKIDIQVLNVNEVSSATSYHDTQVDDEDNIKLVMNKSPEYLSIKDVKNNMLGGNAVFGSYGSEYEPVLRSYELSDEKKIRYYWNENRTKLAETNMINAPAVQSAITINNLNPKVISPKTQILINSENSDVKGIYNITSCRVIFTTSDMKVFKNKILVTFVK